MTLHQCFLRLRGSSSLHRKSRSFLPSRRYRQHYIFTVSCPCHILSGMSAFRIKEISLCISCCPISSYSNEVGNLFFWFQRSVEIDAVAPPSIRKSDPVIKAPLSLIRSSATFATSSAVPGRPAGHFANMFYKNRRAVR